MPQSTPVTPRPQPDTKLAEACRAINKPDAADYDIWLPWALDLIEEYDVRAAKHAKTVHAWQR